MANLIVQRDRAHLMTDSGYFLEDGALMALHPKAMRVEQHSLAIAATGLPILGFIAREMMRTPYPNQDALLRSIVGLTRAAYKNNGLDPCARWSIIVIAFYSEAHKRAGGLTFWTDPAAGPEGMQPWKLYPATEVLLPTVDKAATFGRAIDLRDPKAFDPSCAAMPLIEAQRQDREWEHGRFGCGVAGDVELTTVSATGIETVLLHSYPDEVGRKAAA